MIFLFSQQSFSMGCLIRGGGRIVPLQVFKGKGRHARRVIHTREGSLLFRLFTNWLRRGAFPAR